MHIITLVLARSSRLAAVPAAATKKSVSQTPTCARLLLRMRRTIMNAKKIIIAAALFLSATSAALAQSDWTTGSAADRARAGYAPYGSGLYSYAHGSVYRRR